MGGTSRQDAERVAVIFFNGRGDHVLALPALRALYHLFGNRITLICRPNMPATFFPTLPLKVCEPRTDYINQRHVFDVDYAVSRTAPIDLFLSLNPWHHEYIDILLDKLRPTRSIGFHSAFDLTLDLDRSTHNFDQNFAIPRAIDHTFRLDDFAEPPIFSERQTSIAAEIRSLVPLGQRVLAFHGETKAPKMWPMDRFSTVLDCFLSHAEDVIVLDLGVGPVTLDTGHHPDRIIACRGLSLPLAMALVGKADLFLGVDSCLLHVADLYRVPGVGLFGPSNAAEFGFRFSRHRHLQCDAGMSDIEVDQVVDALSSLLDEIDSQTSYGRALAGVPDLSHNYSDKLSGE
jgi:ADP-heptose:LPS heptosyltransferase